MRFDNINMEFQNTTTEQYVLVTKGKNGMTLLSNRFGSVDIESEDVENCEVIGAGDTVIAAIAVTLANHGWSMQRCCEVANECARYAVSQPGTASVPVEVYDNIIDRFENTDFGEEL
jgi:bifunctional ADP-heptose synthase (sugar kinase/adenylyltransferase)